jgi:hypothetical protein
MLLSKIHNIPFYESSGKNKKNLNEIINHCGKLYLNEKYYDNSNNNINYNNNIIKKNNKKGLFTSISNNDDDDIEIKIKKN